MIRMLRHALAAFLFVALASGALAAELGLVTWYEQTGGVKGALNNVGDRVSGVNICPAANTNANNVPGCDMANDPGYNDNGTPQDGSDDYYTGDLIVRTNDAFMAVTNYNVNGGSDEITITGTAPEGLVFDDLPGFCLLPQSSLSADGRTVSCYLGEKTPGTSQTLAFPVRVLGGNANGSQPGVVEFEVDGPNSQSVTDDTDQSIIVTAAPRWNIRKSLYTVNAYTKTASDGTQTYPEGTKGWRLYYKYYLEVWDDTDPASVDALLGNESLGEDATVTFTDKISELYPTNPQGATGAELMWCRSDLSNSSDPYNNLSQNPSHPERSLSNSGSVSCDQPAVGQDVSVTVSGADLSLNHIPSRSRTGGMLPANRKMGAIGVVTVFVPVADAQAAGGDLPTKNCLADFDPDSISGVSNFGSETENDADNCYARTLHLNDGSWWKIYRGKADPVDWGLPGEGQGEASGWRAGDGWVSPGEEFASYQSYSNVGGADATGVVMCDVMDAATYDVVDLSGQPGNAVYLHESGGYDLNRLRVEYATGYVSSVWPPPTPTGQAVVDECSDASVTWYPTTTEARQHGPITKVRVTALDPVEPGQVLYFFVKNRARSTFANTGALPAGVNAGDPIPNGQVLPNFATYKDDGEMGGNWLVGNYDPKTSMTEPHSGSPGDRLGLTRALVRIGKETGNDDGINSVGLGQQFEFVLKPVFTTNAPAGAAVDDVVQVTDVLPPGLSYVPDSATQGGAAFEPVVTECTGAGAPDPSCTQAGETVLFWDLGIRTPNQEIDPIVFKVEVGFENGDGQVLNNRVFVYSPSDASPQAVRTANRSVVVSVPRELIIAKSVDRTRREVKDAGPYTWWINLKNATPNPLNHMDVIDVLPYIGDGAGNPLGGNTLPRDPPSNFHGVLNFVSVELSGNGGGQCGSGGNNPHYYYTNHDPTTINLDPKDGTNTLGAGSIWCEGTSAGPAAGCGFGNAQVTAVRIRSDNEMGDGEACRVTLKTEPAPDAVQQWHLEGDVYTNNAGASADELSLPVGSNSVHVTVYASSIGDLVWEDSNGDGVQDPGEPGIAGVRVHLLDENGQPVDDPAHPGTPYVVTSDADGHYAFENLPAGNYRLRFEPPANHAATLQDQGGDDARDSDLDPATNEMAVALPRDTHATDFDAGFYPYRSIGDTVFHDVNHNGQPEAGEGLAGVTVRLTPPADVDLGNGAGQPVTTTTDSQGNYRFDNLPAGQYTVTVDESTLPIAHLQGHNTVDPDGGNDSTAQVDLGRDADNLDQDFGYYLNAADLALTKTVSNGTPAVGSQVTFTVTLHNEGPLEATGVEVTDALPAGYRFVSANPSQGSYDAVSGVWTVGSLAQGADATLAVTVRVVASDAAGAYENWAEVSASDQPDVDSVPGVGDDHGHGQDDGKDDDPNNPVDDDEASATTSPVPTVDLSLTKTIDPANARIGDTVTFTVTVSNAPDFTPATGVTVTDQLPSGYALQSASPSQGSYDAATGVWTVGDLNAGASATLTLTATVLGHGEYVNWAEVSASDLPDTDSVPGVGDDHGHGQDDGKDNDPNNPVDDDEASATLGRHLRVHGTIYHDRDVNRAMDAGDPGVSPDSELSHPLYVKVFQDADGDCSTSGDWNFIESVPVQSDGSYDFENAEPDTEYCFVLADNPDGAYSEAWDAPGEGWLYVNPDAGVLPVSVHADDVYDQDFGIFHGSRVSGTVFHDDGRGAGTNANNALQDGSEPGVAGATVTISDGEHSRTTTTDADGNYTLYLPADWGPTQLSHDAGRGTGYNSDGATAEYTAGGADDPAAVSKPLDPAALAGGGNVTNFGVVPEGSFVPDQNGQTVPGGTVVYPHVYTPGSEGSLSFTRPAGDWDYRIRVDLNGDGDFDDPGEGFQPLGDGQSADYTVDDSWPRNPDGSLAGVPVEVEVTAPADAYDGQVDLAPVEASLVWENNADVTETWSVTDVTTVTTSGHAEVSKRVRNVTTGGAFGTSNEASPGDVLEYCIDYRNPSQNSVFDVVVHDPVPSNAAYQPGSLTHNGAALSDAADGDAGEVVAGQVTVRVGELAAGATGSVCFRVVVP